MTRRSMDNYQPIAELWNVSVYECKESCIKSSGNNDNSDSSCKSFIYNNYQYGCRLYDHDGNRPPAILHPANGFDYYKRTSMDGDCQSPSLSAMKEAKQPNAISPPQTSVIQPQQPSVIGPPLPSLPVTEAIPLPPSSETPPEVTPKRPPEVSSKCCATAQPPDAKCCTETSSSCCCCPGQSSGSDCCPPSVAQVAPPTAPTVAPLIAPPVAAAECSVHSYLVIIGQELALPQGTNANDLAGVMVLIDIEQPQCSQYCSSNKGPNDEAIECASMNYFPQSQTCEIHENAASPRGSGDLNRNDQVIYAEKFCQPSDISAAHNCKPDDLFLMHPGQRIDGHELDASTSQPTVDSCLGACLADAACKSASFNSLEQQCVLHDTNLGETPDVLVDAQGWTLVENGCSKGARVKINSPRTPAKHIPRVRPAAPVESNGPASGPFVAHATAIRPPPPTPLDEANSQAPPETPYSQGVKQLISNEIRRAEAKNKEAPTWPSRNIEQSSEPSDWSAWTPCQFEVKGERVRVRTKKCTVGLCPEGDMQVERCRNLFNTR